MPETATIPTDLIPPLKPAELGEYGYIHDGVAKGCTAEELIRRCGGLGLPDAVWTPESDRIVLPTAAALLHDQIASAPQRLGWSQPAAVAGLLGLAACGIGIAWDHIMWSIAGAVLLVGSVALQIARFISLRRIVRRLQPEAVARDTELALFNGWLASQPVTFTRGLQASVVIVGVLQLVVGSAESIELAALIKTQVWEGEWWRLLTATLLHANFTHFWLNIVALSHFSRAVEVLGRPAYTPLVFVSAGLGASIASLAVWPVTSVGASGGVFGLIGFLLVRSYRAGTPIPAYYRRVLWGVTLLTAAVGGALFFIVDNAAHAGGILTGAALGALLPMRPSKRASGRLAIVAAWAIIAGVAAFTCARLLRWA